MVEITNSPKIAKFSRNLIFHKKNCFKLSISVSWIFEFWNFLKDKNCLSVSFIFLVNLVHSNLWFFEFIQNDIFKISKTSKCGFRSQNFNPEFWFVRRLTWHFMYHAEIKHDLWPFYSPFLYHNDDFFYWKTTFSWKYFFISAIQWAKSVNQEWVAVIARVW